MCTTFTVIMIYKYMCHVYALVIQVYMYIYIYIYVYILSAKYNSEKDCSCLAVDRPTSNNLGNTLHHTIHQH